MDVIVHAVERGAFTTADGVVATRIDIEFTNARGAIEAVSDQQVDGIDTQGWKVEPYEHCHDYDYSLRGYPCPGVLAYEQLNPGASVRGYIYFVESPVYPLASIEFLKRRDGSWLERADVRVELPAPR